MVEVRSVFFNIVCNNWIVLPTILMKKQRIKQRFMESSSCLGAIESTKVILLAPGEEKHN